MYARIQNGVVEEFPIESLYERFPFTSFAPPITKSQFPEGIVEIVEEPKPKFDFGYYAVCDNTPRLVDGVWTVGWIVLQYTDNEIEDAVNAKKDEVLNDINIRLAECDWTQSGSLPPDQALPWAQYRDDLQSIPNSAGFPIYISWPTPPAF